jgi:RHS repeat-associated protein
MSYAQGHLAEAYTCSGSCTSKITDDGFSYDQRGAMADYYQSSPNSNGYYHLSGTYWEHGAIKTVSGVGLPTITYGGLDGVGRVTTVTASSGTNPVSGVTYNNGTYSNEPIGALLTVTLGTGDAQNFTYDPNTGRITSYAASVGATPQAVSGSLTWNQNGTLLQNNISDAYNAGNTQNCAYLYDDLMRAASVNCVNGSTNIWNQTFTYGSDSFGNISKNGTGSFQPIYSATTNQIISLPGNFAPTYDANGDLKNDSYHAYTWLADGHVATIDTSTITYDAMGNKVEENVGGTIHEYVSAFGVSAQMTAQSENATTIGLPGGVQALYSGGTLQRFRFPDWQGTIRAESSTARAFTESLAFAPFGERYAVKGAPYNVDSFTGSPDQIVPDEYDFSARELHNGQGRWISPDPMPGPGNKYVYADNDPLSHIDLYGLMAVLVNGLEVGTIDDTNQLTIKGMSESYQATSAETAAEVNFMCSSLDCTAPGTDQMLRGMNLLAPPPATQTASNQQQALATDSQQQGQPAAQNQYTATILGQKVPVTIIGGTADDRSAIRGRLDAAFADINQHAGDLSAEDVKNIQNIKTLTVDNSRLTGTDLRTGTYNLKPGYVTAPGASTAWLASTFAHDGEHVAQFRRGEAYNRETAPRLEREANAVMFRAGVWLGLTATELNHIATDRHTAYNTSPY